MPISRSTKQRAQKNAIPIGRRPLRPSEAWWALSLAARKKLAEERQKGRFGGKPGQAPYWHSQEVGEPGAEIKPLRFIEQGFAEFAATAKVQVSEFLRGY